MISSFHLNHHSLGYYPQAQKSELWPCTNSTMYEEQYLRKILTNSIHLNGYT